MIAVAQLSSLPPKVRERVAFGSSCWEWRGAFHPNGYGRFCLRKSVSAPAHRHVYELLVAPVPKPLVMDHLCRNIRCVNPDHLQPVTNRENLLRGVGPSAVNARKTHCSKGHPYTEENTWRSPNAASKAGRQCRTCNRLKQRALKRRRRAERLAQAEVPRG